MDNTAFGYSSFGYAGFGQSNANSSLVLGISQEVKQVAIWFAIGTTQYRQLIDIGGSFYDSNDIEVGVVTQTSNVVQVHFVRECFLISVYLFDTDEDLSYLSLLPDWEADTVFPQVGGSSRMWNEGVVLLLQEPFTDGVLATRTSTPNPIEAFQDRPEDRSPRLAAASGGEGLHLTVTTTEVEEY